MASPHDLAFMKAAVTQKLVTPEQAATVQRVQLILAKWKVDKTLAQLVVEGGWAPEGRVHGVAGKIKGHPELECVRSSLAIEAHAQKLDGPTKEQVEKLRAELDEVGHKRSLGEIAADLGVVKPPARTVDLPKGGTHRTTAGRTKGTGARTGEKPTGKRGSDRQKKMLILGGAAAGAVLLLALLVIAATSSGTKKKDEDSQTASSTPPPPPAAKTTRPPDPPPKKREPDPDPVKPVAPADATKEKAAEDLWMIAQSHYAGRQWNDAVRKIEELKTGYAATQFYQDNRNTIEISLTEAKRRSPEETAAETPATPEAKKDLSALKADYEKRKRERIDTARRRLEDAKKSLEAEVQMEKSRVAGLMKRLAGQKLDLALRSGMKLDGSSVVAMNKESVKLSCFYEGASVEMDFPWEVLSDKSYVALQKAIHAADGAVGWYEIGRQCITRKLWKDAKAAFEECRKLDASFADRVPNLDPILNAQGAFKGSSKKIGRDTLALGWDWSDPEQAQDFVPTQQGEMKVAGGTATMTAKGRCYWSVKEVGFEKDVSIDVTVTIDDKSAFWIGCFWDGMDRKAYFLRFSATGVEFYRWDGAPPPQPTSRSDAKLSGDVALRFSVRDGKWKVQANNADVFSADDGAHTKGIVHIGAEGGTVTLKKLGLQGKVNPTELQKLFDESEVLVRRAMEGDLRPKKGDKEEKDDVEISADDEYFLAQVDEGAKFDYEKLRYRVREAIKRGHFQIEDVIKIRGRRNLFEDLDELIASAPTLRGAYYWRAQANLLRGRSDLALADFTEAAKDPDFYEARAGLGQLFFNELKFAQAKQHVEDALKIAPDCASAIALKAFMKFVDGDPKGSVADFDVAHKLDPSDEDIREQRGNIANVIKGPQHLGCKHVKEFPHYIVMTDISMEKTKLYGERLEAAWLYYKETFKEFYREDPRRPKPRVAIFNTREMYMTYGELTLSRRQERTLGYFHPMYKELLLFEDVDMDDTLQTLYHEAFHQFMNCMVARAPYWYNEGIAEYMGGLTIDKGKVVQKARILDGRLKGLKMNLKQAFPFENIMQQSPGEFYSGPVSFKYAQAWCMVHFFYQYEGGKHRKLIDAYFKALLDGKENKEAFQEAFGSVDLKALKAEWTAYAEKLQPEKK